ncbi:MAG: enoyl-CoA hydratase/isomerase family protein [Propionibacterium sp.]|nr:enoyl-CoA hydratase/isomerase family protein [Propionibacterium sp.]
MTEPILLEVSDGLARITLNRPGRLNAFNAELAREWERVTAHVAADEGVGAILIDGAGPAFCAGGDVAEMGTAMVGGSQLEALAHTINTGIRALVESAIPVAAAAHGATAGGGLGILLSSDYAVAGTSSRIGARYANIGLSPDLSVTAQLARAVGERRALQLTLSDRMLTAEEALGWGLVAEVVPDDEVAARAEAVARSWLEGATRAFGQAKRLVRAASTRSFAEQVDDEARTIGQSFDTAEAKERIAAFVEAAARRKEGQR